MVSRYVDKFRRIEYVSTAVICRPHSRISMHPNAEFVIMELQLQYPDKIIAKMVDEVYREAGSEYACSMLYSYLKRNGASREKVCVQESN